MLERRALLAASVTDVMMVNASRAPGHQSEASIAVDPTDPARLFGASNFTRTSLFAYRSADGGATWTTREIATGGDSLPKACCDPSVTFDSFGNLYLAYLSLDANGNTDTCELALSTDGGQTFTPLATFPGKGDQPTVAAGPGVVWVAYQLDAGGAAASAAVVTGLGQVKRFGRPQSIEGPPRQNVGDIAVGPRGQAVVGYQRPPGGEGPSSVVVRVDADGPRRRGFGELITVSATNVGDRDTIPAQQRRSIDAAVDLAYDLSGGPYTGRLYLCYGDESPNESNNTEVLLRYSDDDGRTWSEPQRVNDDVTGNSQFFPRVEVDQATGIVGLAWHDARSDAGVPGEGSTNATPNDDTGLWGTVGVPTPAGVDFAPNVRLSAGMSNAFASQQLIEYGDYIGLDFFRGQLHAAWADNSNSTGDNPDGTLNLMDIYTARAAVAAEPPRVVGAPTATVTAKPAVSRGKRFLFTVTYTDPVGGAVMGLDDQDVLVTGPGEFSQNATLRKARSKRGVTTATYQIEAPGGRWDPGDAGRYTIALRPDQVTSSLGIPAAGRDLFGSFAVG